MKYFVYVIKSIKENFHYVGMTTNLEERLSEHNKRRVRSTKAYAPFVLLYKRSFGSRIKARDYEKYLKIRSNKEKLLRSLKD